MQKKKKVFISEISCHNFDPESFFLLFPWALLKMVKMMSFRVDKTGEWFTSFVTRDLVSSLGAFSKLLMKDLDFVLNLSDFDLSFSILTWSFHFGFYDFTFWFKAFIFWLEAFLFYFKAFIFWLEVQILKEFNVWLWIFLILFAFCY